MDSSSSQVSRRHIFDGTLRVFLAEALFLPTGLITTVFLTHRLGSSGYGLYALVATLIAWIEWGIASLFSRPTIKYISEAEDWRPVGASLIRLHLLVSTGIVALLWLLSTFIARLLHEPILAAYIRLFALDIPLFSITYAYRNILIGLGSFRQRALISAGRYIARLLLIVLLVELGFSIPGAILGSMGASLVEFLIGYFYLRPSLFGRSNLPTWKFWENAIPLFLSALSVSLYNRLDLFILKGLGATTEQTGIYNVAQNLAVIPGTFALSFSPLLLSTLSRLLRTGNSYQAKELGRDAMRLVIGLLPFTAMVAGAAPDIVQLVFGPTFLPAAPLLALLNFGSMILVLVSVATSILISVNRSTWAFALTGPLPLLAIVGHLVLIPRLGALGASLVTALVASLGAGMAVLTVYYIWQILPPAGTLWRSILVCGLAYLLAVLWPVPNLLLLIKLPIIGFLIPLAFLALGEFSAKEIAWARAFLYRQILPS